ncbi:hypothetical protein A7985_12530 [Pseudoalteromonas luteoviolacea]|uniref:Peptidase M1 membrane alanine aminopeptidase domain-containing protein n=1 Tax=Pseudoalteromonas luteoviolacea TaxID=43657 RepID=A0A1C0TR45_9GAMM|nr:hypothetical protein [Pseudoalteromonas luteoviolacea]OCQ21432.1 hypothetical protein A7985_12530 [Pseudoalteromonas luteoviolacea]
MFSTSFLFELKYRLRSVATWGCLVAMIIMGYREMLGGEWDALMQSGRVARNSPYAIYYLFMYYTFWAATVGSALVIPTLLRDLNSKTADYLYSFDIKSKHYFIGKYLACLCIVFLVMSSVAIAMVTLPTVSNLFGLYPASDFIATSWPHIMHALLLWVLPSCIVYTAIPFALTALTGRATPAYASMMMAVGMFVLITALFGDGAPQAPWLQIVDPLGKVTVEGQIFYWTAEQRVTQFLSLDGALLYNRLLYLALAISLLAFAWWRFDLAKFRTSNSQSAVTKPVANTKQHTHRSGKLSLTPLTLITSDAVAYWIKFSAHAGYLQARQIMTNKAFYFSMLTLSLMLIIAGLSYRLPGIEGSAAVLPKTHTLLPVLIYPSLIFTMLAASFFVVDQCHKDHQLNTAQLVAVCPAPDWQAPLSHIVCAVIVACTLTLVPVSGLLGSQLLQGFTDPDWQSLLHLSGLVLLPLMLAYVFIAIISYGLVQSKIAAQVIAVMLCISPAIFNETHAIENFMYLWAWPSIAQLSELASTEQFIVRDLNIMVYWLSFYCVLLVLISWLWPRGMIAPFMDRVRSLPQKVAPRSLSILVLASLVFTYQAYSVYDEMIVNGQFKTKAQGYAQQADYENRYRQYETQPQPKVQHADITLSLAPSARALNYTAHLTLTNPHQLDIEHLFINTEESVFIEKVTADGHALTPTVNDPTHQVSIWPLNKPQQPSQQSAVTLSASMKYHGYQNVATQYQGNITKDASYINTELWPAIGFERDKIIQDNALREKYQLPTLAARYFTQSKTPDVYQSNDADLMTYKLSIEAPIDQVVVAPGELINHQVSQSRHTYIYEMAIASHWKPAIASAQYQMKRATWVSKHNQKEVIIELYYVTANHAVLDAMLQSATHALEQGEAVFGTYPYDSLKIAAVPQGMGGQTVSANLILIPEMSAWQHNYQQPPEVDWLGYNLHHLVAQVWWQTVAIANTEGYPLLSQGVPTWFALTKAKLNSEAKQQLLAIITDEYLLERTKESSIEKSALTLTQQPYAASKSQLAVYAASQLIGDTKFRQVIKAVLTHYEDQLGQQFLSAPLFFKQLMRSVQSPKHKTQLQALYQQVVLHDFTVRNVQVEQLDDNYFSLVAELKAVRIEQSADGASRVPYSGAATINLHFEPSDEASPHVREVYFNNGKAELRMFLPKLPNKLFINENGAFVDIAYSDNVRQL